MSDEQRKRDLLAQLDALQAAMNDVWQADTIAEMVRRHEQTKRDIEWIKAQIAAQKKDERKH